jgi:hypothetical protein
MCCLAEFHRPGPSIIERIERWVSEAISRVLGAISGVAVEASS